MPEARRIGTLWTPAELNSEYYLRLLQEAAVAFLIDEVFTLWGVMLSGEVKYRGERFDDVGKLTVTEGRVKNTRW